LNDSVVARASQGFKALYGERLRELVLFGSRARGDANEDSDYDLLVVVDDLSRDDQFRADELSGSLLTDEDAIVTPLLLSTQRANELRTRERHARDRQRGDLFACYNRVLSGLQRTRELADYDSAFCYSANDARRDADDAEAFGLAVEEFLRVQGFAA
jgi:predicted nucleotidyltransferase